VHRWGSDPDPIPPCVAPQGTASWLLSHALQRSLEGESLHRAATELPMVVLLQISTQGMETIGTYAVNLV